jgi:pimeloyl-ACP methyl ester carboxylesterase
MPRHVITVDGRRLVCHEAGDPNGPALVLLHAFPLTSAMWRPQLDAPPAGWRVLAPDFAGLGESEDRIDGDVELDDYARDVLATADQLQVKQAVVCGVSLGGYVALALARLAPGRLRGLVLADTKAAADTPQAREGRVRMLDVLQEDGVEGVADEMISKLLGNTTTAERPDLVASVRAMVETNRPDGVRHAILRLRDRPDATAQLAGIDVPTLVVVGREDIVTPRADAEMLQQGIAGAVLHEIPSAGHLASLEQPEAFNTILDDFLDPLR